MLSHWRRLDDQDIALSDVLWDQFALMSLELHLCVGTRRVHKQPKAKTCNIYYYVITTSKYVGLHIQLWRLIIMNVHQCKWQYEIYYQKNKALNIKTNCQNLLKTSFWHYAVITKPVQYFRFLITWPPTFPLLSR